MITFEWDSRDLEMWRGDKFEKAVTRALSKAGGDAVRKLKSGSGRLVRQKKRFKVRKVNDALPLRFPRGVKTLSNLEWRMDVSGKTMPVADFPHRQLRGGVSIAVNTGKRTLIRSAFIARMKSGHVGVFLRELTGAQGPMTRRQQRKGHKFRAPRLPIEEAFTTRVSDVFHDGGFIPFVQAGAQATFSASFTRLLPLELARIARGG